MSHMSLFKKLRVCGNFPRNVECRQMHYEHCNAIKNTWKSLERERKNEWLCVGVVFCLFVFKYIAYQKSLLWEDGNALLFYMENTLIGRPCLVKLIQLPIKYT